jgi:hypothetical protein
MKKTVLSVLALSALVYSCKKDDDKSNAEKIVGKWNEVRIIENSHTNGADHKDTATIPVGFATIEFLSSGIAYDNGPTYKDTATYKVDGSNLILKYYGNTTFDTVQIKNLTGSDMTLYAKDPGSNGNYDETTVDFKK